MRFEHAWHGDLAAVAQAAWDVRGKQRTYFKTRSEKDLVASRQAEQRLDRLLHAIASAPEPPPAHTVAAPPATTPYPGITLK